MAMNLKALNLEMERYASSGLTLTTEEQMLLKLSLPILKSENNFSSVMFWGKVLGTEKDYYVVQGRGKDFIRNKFTFYSLDTQVWRYLYPPSEADTKKFHLVKTRFYGDPTEFHQCAGPRDDGAPDMENVMLEELRLSTLIHLVDLEAGVAPLGAFTLNPEGKVVVNNSFSGLSTEEAVTRSSYVHMRLPGSRQAFVPSWGDAGPDRVQNFLEPIDRDYPEGVWILQADDAVETVTLRNLWWPGLTFYHRPSEPDFGCLYMGFGDRNSDLPFMM